MAYHKGDEVTRKLLSKYQICLETSMKGNGDFIFDCAHFIVL